MRKVVLVLTVSILACVGCQSVPYNLVKDYHDSVGSAYLRYLEADTTLDADSKRIRRTPVERMDVVLKKMGG